MDKIDLRAATREDIPLLKVWDEQPHVIACDPNGSWDWEEELGQEFDWQEMLIAELNGRPIGFVQIIDPAEEVSHYWGDVEPNLRAIDIWIGAAEDLNHGYGTVMMNQAFERCFAHENVTAIIIDPLASNVKAHRFYERLGFRFQGERTFEGELCRVYRLLRSDWKKGANNQ